MPGAPQTIPGDLFKMVRDSPLTRKRKVMEMINGIPKNSHPETKHLLLMFAQMMRQERRVHPDNIIRTVSILLEAAYNQAKGNDINEEPFRKDRLYY